METICPFCHQKLMISQAEMRTQVCCPHCRRMFTANPLSGLGGSVVTPTLSNSPSSRSSLPAVDRSVLVPGGGAQGPADLLGGYRGAPEERGSFFVRFFGTFTRPMRVARLRRQVKGLQQTLDAAWERLGVLAVGYPPFHGHLGAEISELSAIQQQIHEAQSTAHSLAQSESANVKLVELQHRQRKLVIAIGQKVEASAADIPEGASQGEIIKRLRPVLEFTERELLQMEGASSKMPFMVAGAVLGSIVVLCVVWWLLTPEIPEDIRKAVFDDSRFSKPVIWKLPGDDRGVVAKVKRDKSRNRKPVLPLYHSYAIKQFQKDGKAGKALLNLLAGNKFVESETVENTNRYLRVKEISLLTYQDTLEPYCVSEKEDPARKRKAYLPKNRFQSPFSIILGKRKLKSIDSKKSYRDEMPGTGEMTDAYELTFSYTLKASFPEMPPCAKVFKGKAKAYRDPDTDLWEVVDLTLDDKGGQEYMKVLEEQEESDR